MLDGVQDFAVSDVHRSFEVVRAHRLPAEEVVGAVVQVAPALRLKVAASHNHAAVARAAHGEAGQQVLRFDAASVASCSACHGVVATPNPAGAIYFGRSHMTTLTISLPPDTIGAVLIRRRLPVTSAKRFCAVPVKFGYELSVS